MKTQNKTMDTPRIRKALKKAGELHRGQKRKGGAKIRPYLDHLTAVAEILAKYSMDEDTIIAGLLHDSLEDFKYTKYTMEMLESDFGPRVAKIVEDVSQVYKSADGKKLSWSERKKKYVNHLIHASKEAQAVSAADKISNITDMMEAYKEDGEKLWKEFNASKEEKMSFYEQVKEVVFYKIDKKMYMEFDRLFKRACGLFGLKDFNYVVRVVDNFHFGEDDSYKMGPFLSCETALLLCRIHIDSFLYENYRDGISADGLYKQFCMFGEDPHIISKDVKCSFSGWDYAKKKAAEIASKDTGLN